MEMVTMGVELHTLEATPDLQAMDHHRVADQVVAQVEAQAVDQAGVLDHHLSGSHSSEDPVEEHLQEEVEEEAVERRLVDMEALVVAEAVDHHHLEDHLHPSSLCLVIPRPSR